MRPTRVGRPKKPLVLSGGEKEQLRSIARSRELPRGFVRRARMVLLSARGVSNTEIAARFGTTAPRVSFWRRRYRQQGIMGLYDEVRPGRPRMHDDARIAMLINRALGAMPRTTAHWTVRSLSMETGLSKSAVHRYISLWGLRSHPGRPAKVSTARPLVEKVRARSYGTNPE